MPRSIIKSAIYAPARQRFVLHACFEDDVLQGYTVTTQSNFDLSGKEDYDESAEHFIVTPSQSPTMVYGQACRRYRQLVEPTL